MQVSQPCWDINTHPGAVLVSVGQKLVDKTLTPLPLAGMGLRRVSYATSPGCTMGLDPSCPQS